MDWSIESLSTSDDSDQYFQDKTNISEELIGFDGFMNPDSPLETRKDNYFQSSLGHHDGAVLATETDQNGQMDQDNQRKVDSSSVFTDLDQSVSRVSSYPTDVHRAKSKKNLILHIIPENLKAEQDLA